MLDKFNDYRYFLIDGGRGGGKSHSIVRFILYLTDKYNMRVVCAREQQINIAESVYSLFTDLIREYNLSFDIQSTKIIARNSGSTTHFRGLNEKGKFNIQGLENVTLLFCDESQALTKRTLDVLIPTIRRNDAKIFFAMNRHIHNDPAYEMFINRDDCLHIHLNYNDNPFCTDALKREAFECLKKSEADYRHIWLGEPLSQSEDSVFGHEELQGTKNAIYPLRENYGLRIGGFDIARYGDDKCACVGIQQMGALHWAVYYVDQWDHKDLNYTTGRILMTSNEQGFRTSIIDEDGIGAGPLDTLNKGRGLNNFIGFRNPALSYSDNKFYGNNRTANVYKLKDMILKGYLHIMDDQLLNELETLKYTFDHNQRRILISKDVMRTKFKVKSPNIADALVMAVSHIGEINYEQDKQYYTVPNAYKDTDILKEAGIR
jgi:phage terminase large subunit